MKKKSAALIITLMIVTVASLLVLGTSRSVITRISQTTTSIDTIIAEQAATSGLELGLSQYSNAHIATCFYTISASANPSCGAAAPTGNSTIYAEVQVENVDADTSRVTSTGHYGRVTVSHRATIEKAPNPDTISITY